MFSIHGHGRKPTVVPSTYLGVGGATLERKFTVPQEWAGRRLLLHFDDYRARIIGCRLLKKVSTSDIPFPSGM
jgi:hypothetical protein